MSQFRLNEDGSINEGDWFFKTLAQEDIDSLLDEDIDIGTYTENRVFKTVLSMSYECDGMAHSGQLSVGEYQGAFQAFNEVEPLPLYPTWQQAADHLDFCVTGDGCSMRFKSESLDPDEVKAYLYEILKPKDESLGSRKYPSGVRIDGVYWWVNADGDWATQQGELN